MTPLKIHNTLALLIDLQGEVVTEYEAAIRRHEQSIALLTKKLTAAEAATADVARLLRALRDVPMPAEVGQLVNAVADRLGVSK